MKSKDDQLGDVAYQGIKKMVLSGRLPQDKPIVERMVSQEIGVSRTPIREALNRLEQEGLVRIVPRRGAFPVTLGLTEYLDILAVREVLEGLAARMAVDHVSNAKLRDLEEIFSEFHDPDNPESVSHQAYALANVGFHREILELSNNPKLIETVKDLHDHLSLVRWRTIEITNRRGKSIEEHKRILEALKRRDPDRAETAARQHIQSLQGDIAREAKNRPDLFAGQAAEAE
jgi:DNA-binding GntR family transcriptional regulator